VKVTSNLNAAGNSNTIGSLFTTGGNVGVGTVTPGYLLDVNGHTRIVNNLLINTAANNNLGINLPVGGYGIHWGSGYSRIYDDGDLRICTDDTMHFHTGSLSASSPGTERITLTPGGNVGIGTNAPNYTLAVNGPAQFGNNTLNNKILVLYDVTSGESLATGTSFYGFGINNVTLRYQVEVTSGNHKFYCGSTLRAQFGSIVGSTNIITNSAGNYMNDWPSGWGGSFATQDISCESIYGNGMTQRSDIRKKQDITDYTRGLSEILRMRPVSFKLKANINAGDQYGFIAQEMEEIIPEIINHDSDGFKSIKDAYSPILVNAIKELNQELDAALVRLDLALTV
jgi:hypothetical protein